MNPEIKSEWVAALRSGEYQQGPGYLNSGRGSFCCLGVLCEIAVRHGVIESPVLTTRWTDMSMAYDGQTLNLPLRVQEWSGLLSQDGQLPLTVENEPSHQALADANDDDVPFHEIADMIEEYL